MMITIQPITTTDHDLLTPLTELYEQAFPDYERRDTKKLIQLVADEDRFSCLALMNDGQFVGFFTQWNLDLFYYGEHFAICEDVRGKRLGSEAAKVILADLEKPLILEVELPTDEWSARRIEFYKKVGFELSTEHYMQPPYEEGFDFIPMQLMEYGGTLTQTHFPTIVKTLHGEIYGIKIA